jgi:lipoprotein Spr
MSGWARAYVGIPYRPGGRDRSGCDCFGLLALVLRERFGLRVPDPAIPPGPMDDTAALAVEYLRQSLCWREVGLAAAEPGDALSLRVCGLPVHCGVVVEPGRFLHTMAGTNAVLERYTGPAWLPRIAGVYRYREVPRG